MKRIALISLIVLLLLIVGLILFIHMNRDKITSGIAKVIQESTGKPLYTESAPKLSFFPSPGVKFGKSSWGDPKVDELSVSLEQCSFSVSLLQLLSGTIAVNDIFLEEPIITIHNKNKGSSTTSEPSQKNSKSSATAAKEALSLPPIEINALSIKNGSFIFSNDYGQQFALKELEVSAADLKPGHVGTIKVSALTSIQPENISFSIRCDASILPEASSIDLKSFRLQVSPDKGLPFSAPITIGGQALCVLNKNSLEDISVQADLNGFTSSVKGSLSLEPTAGRLTLKAEGSLKQLAKEFGIMLSTPEKGSLEKLSVTADVILNNKTVQVQNLAATVDETKATGNINAALPNKIEGSLAITTINLDRYLPVSIARKNPIEKIIRNAPTSDSSLAAAPSSPKRQSSAQRLPSVNFTLTARDITFAKLKIQNLKSVLAGADNAYRLNPCSFTFYESQISIDGLAKNLLSQPLYDGSVTTTNINLAALLRDLDPSGANVVRQGAINLSAKMSASGEDAEQIKRTLSGSAKINGKDIEIGFDSIPKAVAELANLGKQTFTTLDGNIQATNGTLTINQFILIGKPASASAKGVIVLPNDFIRIKADIAIGDTIIPVIISGKLTDPSYGVDPIRIIQGAVEAILKGGGEKTLDAILPKKTQKNIQNATEKIFNKIFGK